MAEFYSQTIRIRTVDGHIQIDAKVRNGLAYHKSRNKPGWSVTHLSSGMSLDTSPYSGFHTVEEAKEFIAYACSLSVDWESDLNWREWWPTGPSDPNLLNLRTGWVNWQEKRHQEKLAERERPNLVMEFFGA